MKEEFLIPHGEEMFQWRDRTVLVGQEQYWDSPLLVNKPFSITTFTFLNYHIGTDVETSKDPKIHLVQILILQVRLGMGVWDICFSSLLDAGSHEN